MNSLKQDVVKRYIAKYSDLPNKMLAELIFTKEEGLFATREAARALIRYYKGAIGESRRKSAMNSGHFEQPTISSIQEGLKKLGIVSRSEAPEHLQLGEGRYLILSDVHIPFQNDEALACALQYGVDNGATHIILNGDIMDTYDVSRFLKETKRPKISEELEMTRNFFTFLRELFPNSLIYYKLGNHEERMRHYLLRNARELSDIEDLSLESLLKLDEFKIQIVNREMIKIGKLTVIHGHEDQGGAFSPVSPARGLFTKAKTSAIIGHHHTTSEHSESNLHGERIVCYSTGCLCELTPEYRPYAYTKWNHGFAFVTVEADGSFQVNNLRISNGKVS